MTYDDVVELLKNSKRVVEEGNNALDKQLQWFDSSGKLVASGYDYKSNRQPKCSNIYMVDANVDFTEDETSFLVSLGKRV